MKNREWLQSMSIYDLLMMIEKNINDIYTNTPIDDDSVRGAVCVMECLIGRDEANVVCREQVSCRECIQTWLNKEEGST